MSAPNNACSGWQELGGFEKYFSGFGFFLLSKQIPARPTTTITHTVPFSILLLDIDHFKKINDVHGHEIGDQALVGVVAVCSAILRKDDIFARFGGEEFIALLPNTTQETAVAIAERLRVALEGAALPTAAGDLRLTVSIGISPCCGESVTTVQELIRRADEALYQAKESGRNKVVCWRDQLRDVNEI